MNENVSKVMSKNKGKNTKPELFLRSWLWKKGFRGYRLHPQKIPGKPDICFISKKVAIFVNGCFWHQCPHCNYNLPKHNRPFWRAKFANNVARDLRKINDLKKTGWKVIVIWECQLTERKIEKTITSILNKISS